MCNSPPNDSFSGPHPGRNGRECKQMEDKADPAATLALHGEQIIRLRERMECLAARVSKTEADVAHRAGTADSLHFGMSYPSRSAQRRTIPEQR